MGKRDTGTGTTSKPRKGSGTILKYRMAQDIPFVVLERQNGQRALLALSPELSARLLAEYGFQETATFISVSPLMGMKVEYEETATGMLVDLRPLKN